MTRRTTLNPKKLRPYDQPPRRRRVLIPDAPGTAAIGFFAAGAVWLMAATGIGLLAIGLRLFPDLSLNVPLPFDLAFQVDARRAHHAFVNALVYGWLSNAGFAAMLFATPRLLGRPLAMERIAVLGVAAWNMALAGGIAALYVFELGPHGPLTSMPWWIDGGLATGAFLVLVSFALSVGFDVLRSYVSTWFAGVALLSLLGLTTANVAISFFPLPELAIALTSAYVSRGIETLWLLGIALAALHYVVPRATGNPLYSGGIAVVGFILWLMLAPVAPVAALVDPVIPYVITSIGIVATILLLAPAFLVVTNLVQTIRGRWTLAFATGTGAVPFAIVALAFLLASPTIQAIGSLRAVQVLVGGTEWEVGAFVFAALGTYTFALLALAEHAQPRLLRRAWGGGVLSAAVLWTIWGGATLAGLGLMGAGLAEGSLRAAATPPDVMNGVLLPYRAIGAAGLGLLAVGGLAAVVNLFLMFTSAEPAEYAVPGAPVAAGSH